MCVHVCEREQVREGEGGRGREGGGGGGGERERWNFLSYHSAAAVSVQIPHKLKWGGRESTGMDSYLYRVPSVELLRVTLSRPYPLLPAVATRQLP